MKRILILMLLCLCGALVQAQNYQRDLDRAYEHLRNGNLNDAENAYKLYCRMAQTTDAQFEAQLNKAKVQGTGMNLSVGGTTAERYFTERVRGLDMNMVYVEGGYFLMGATGEQGSYADDDETPVRQVNLNSFYIGECEVTQFQWTKIMGTTIETQASMAGRTDYAGIGLTYPMYYVSWDEAREFCRRLSELTGRTYRLPTEAEWEYAARGGKKSQGTRYSGGNDVAAIAWCNENSKSSTQPVKTRQPNALGLYDMSGNVFEWCSDWYAGYSASALNNPTGPASGEKRVFRGGDWSHSASRCRVSYRLCELPGRRANCVGFRVVMVP